MTDRPVPFSNCVWTLDGSGSPPCSKRWQSCVNSWCIRELDLPDDLFPGIARRVLSVYRNRASVEEPLRLRTHFKAKRLTFLSASTEIIPAVEKIPFVGRKPSPVYGVRLFVHLLPACGKGAVPAPMQSDPGHRLNYSL